MSPVDAAPYGLLVLVITLLGRVVARPLRLPTNGLEGFAYAYGLGTGVGSLLLFALVAVRALGLPSGTAGLDGGPGRPGPGVFDAILWLGFLVALVEGSRLSRARASARRRGPSASAPVPPPPRPPLSRTALLPIELVPLGLAALLVLSALAPEVGLDALAVHLPASARFVRDGVRPMAGVLGGEAPLGFTLLAAPHLHGAWPAGPALLAATAGLALVAVVHAEAARRAGRRVAALLASLLLVTPAITAPAATFGPDLAVGLHATLALLCASRAARDPSRASVLAAGLLAGFAGNDARAGLLVALATGLSVHVALGLRRGARPALHAGALAVALCVPWFVRAFRDTGNPLFPFAVERLGAGWADPTIVDGMALGPFRHGGPLLGFGGRVGAPLRDAFARGEGAALPFALLLVAVVAWALRRPREVASDGTSDGTSGGAREGRALLVGGSALALFGLLGHPHARFLVPVLALVALAAASGLARLRGPTLRSRPAALALGALLLVACAWDAAATARRVGPRLAALRSPTAAAAYVEGALPDVRAGAAFAATVPGPVLFASEATAAIDADAISTTPARNGLLTAARLTSPSNAYLREEMRRRGLAAFVYRPARPQDQALADKALDLFRRRLGTIRTSPDGPWQAFVLDPRR